VKDCILNVQNLSLKYKGSTDIVVSDLSFSITQGETLGILGRSGCGKSTIAWTVMGMAEIMGIEANITNMPRGSILFNGRDILDASERVLRELRWKQISIVAQYSMNSFNPIYTISKTMEETMKRHMPNITKKDIVIKLNSLMEMVQLDHRTLHSFPHELSGGMRQRVAIAMSVMLDPKLLILDEATTGLDVIIEADILYLIKKIREDRGISILFISHDKRIHQAFCDRGIQM